MILSSLEISPFCHTLVRLVAAGRFLYSHRSFSPIALVANRPRRLRQVVVFDRPLLPLSQLIDILAGVRKRRDILLGQASARYFGSDGSAVSGVSGGIMLPYVTDDTP